MGQPHSLAASCPTGGGLATALQPAGPNRTFLLGVDSREPSPPAGAQLYHLVTGTLDKDSLDGCKKGIRQIGAILHAKAVSASAGRVCD